MKQLVEVDIILKGLTKEAKESLGVAICNGAVYEPKFKIIK